jgi:hypothetical protein
LFDWSRYNLTAEQIATLRAANDALVSLRQCRVAVVRASDSPGLASWALRSYQQLWLRRVTTLAEGAASEWNAQRLVNVSVLLRALLETVAAFFSIVEQGKTQLAAGDLRAFHSRLLKAMYGTRQGREQHPELPEATNVLTLVDRLGKLLPGVRRYYEALCEVVHPNSDGVTVFGEVDHDAWEVRLTEHRACDSFLVPCLMGGIRMLRLGPALIRLTKSDLEPIVAALEKKHGPHPSTWPEPTP